MATMVAPERRAFRLAPMEPLRPAIDCSTWRRALSRIAGATVCIALGSLACAGATAQTADTACGNPFVNGYGPYDYRSDHQKLKIVEDYHFTPRVESLVSGASASLGADIDYTLRAFPNHHRALFSIMNLGAKLKSPMPVGAQFSVECYFRRALLFRPDDAIARMIFATFLARNGRKPEAIREVDFSVQSAPDNAFTQYNAGLMYVEMREFDKALVQAHRALALGFERPELRQQLQAAGKWVEVRPVDTAASLAAPPPAAPSAAPPAGSASAAAR